MSPRFSIAELTRHIPSLKYLPGCAPELLAQVNQLIPRGLLGETLRRRYPEAHDVRTDHALFDHVAALKSRFLRNAQAIAKVAYDNKLHFIQPPWVLSPACSACRATSSKPSARSAWRACSRRRRPRS